MHHIFSKIIVISILTKIIGITIFSINQAALSIAITFPSKPAADIYNRYMPLPDRYNCLGISIVPRYQQLI